MQVMKKQKWPILCAVVMIVVVLAGNFLFTVLSGRRSVEDCISVGKQYLNELNYTSAILEFTNAIEMEPTNREARIGLSRAYSATEDYDFAAQILTDLLDEDRLDRELSDALLDVYKASGDTAASVELLENLIKQTDDAAYYERITQALSTVYQAPHSYAEGLDQSLYVRNGSLVSRGNNTLGQLGSASNLGRRDAVQNDFASADFSGIPQRVYCGGRTSYVIDDGNNLWAAGENRWGQMGLSYATTLPESGWRQLTSTGDVISAVGTVGGLYVLRGDGGVWYAGVDSSQQFKHLSMFTHVLKIASSGNAICLLTGAGSLYNITPQGTSATRIATNVKDFSVYNGRVVYIDNNGGIYLGYDFSMPADWIWQDNGTVLPDDFSARAIAVNDTLLLLMDAGGQLHQLKRDGILTDLSLSSPVIALYNENGTLVAELEDTSILVWQAGDDSPNTLYPSCVFCRAYRPHRSFHLPSGETSAPYRRQI